MLLASKSDDMVYQMCLCFFLANQTKKYPHILRITAAELHNKYEYEHLAAHGENEREIESGRLSE